MVKYTSSNEHPQYMCIGDVATRRTHALPCAASPQCGYACAQSGNWHPNMCTHTLCTVMSHRGVHIASYTFTMHVCYVRCLLVGPMHYLVRLLPSVDTLVHSQLTRGCTTVLAHIACIRLLPCVRTPDVLSEIAGYSKCRWTVGTLHSHTIIHTHCPHCQAG